MPEFYIYDTAKDKSTYGFYTEKGALKVAIRMVRAHKNRQYNIYKQGKGLGVMYGRVYIGQHNGKDVPKYKTYQGTFVLKSDGSLGKMTAKGKW